MVTESFEEKPYLSQMSMTDARTMFRIRTNMVDTQMNQQSDKQNAKKLWKCAECGNIDAESHIVWCPFFVQLRKGKSLKRTQIVLHTSKKSSRSERRGRIENDNLV